MYVSEDGRTTAPQPTVFVASSRLRRAIVILIVMLAAASPLILGEGALHVAAAVLVLGMFAMSLALLVGHAGLPMLGHAAFFGGGAYMAALLTRSVSANVLLTLPAAALAMAVLGYAFAWVALRTRGLQLMLVSISFAGLMHALIDQAGDFFGGDDGISTSNAYIGLIFWIWRLDDPRNVYVVIVIVLAVVYAGLRHLLATPRGKLIVAIRDNDIRIRSLGTDVTPFLRAWVSIAAGVAGIAGALHVYLYRYVGSSMLSVGSSVDALIMIIVGGVHSLAGSLIGAAALFLVRDELSNVTTHWMFAMGAIFIVFVLWVPGGLYEAVPRWLTTLRERLIAGGSEQ